MNNLVEFKETNPYKLAILTGIRFKDMEATSAKQRILETIAKTYFEGGFKAVSKEQGGIIANSVFDEICRLYAQITNKDFELLCSNGVRGDYGEFLSLSVVTFSKWCKEYLRSEARLRAKNELAPKEVKPVATKTEAEYEWKQAMKRQFENFKKTGILAIEFPNFQYHEYVTRGLISLDREEMEAIFEIAKGKVIEKKKIARLNPKSISELGKLSAFIERIETGKPSKEDTTEIQQEARIIAIKNYYNSITDLKL